MRQKLEQGKPVIFVGSTKDDISDFPEEVRRACGYGIWQAQLGRRVGYAKAMKGALRDVIEIAADDERGERTYRAVYTVTLDDRVYVLHAFQKKSRQGIATSKAELDLIERRLREAKKQHEEHHRR